MHTHGPTSVTPTSPEALPRERWAEHPHWPSQVLLLGSHESFRRTSRRLVELSAGGADPWKLGWTFRAWKAGMHSHEGYEEHKLYPFLERRWGVSCEGAQAGHVRLHALEQRVFEALDGPTEQLTEALRAHDEALHEHLELEEQLVVPLLLALSPEQFQEFTRHGIRTLLRRLEEREEQRSTG